MPKRNNSNGPVTGRATAGGAPNAGEGNANSPAAASAASPITAPAATASPAIGVRRVDATLEAEARSSVLPVSALATALAPFYDGQAADNSETVVDEPQGDAGAETAAEGPGEEPVPEATPAGDETQTEQSPTEQPEAPAEAQPGETPAAAGDSPGVQKRIEGLLRKVSELERRLATGQSGAIGDRGPTGPTPLDQVMDLGELDRRAADAEAANEQAERLLRQLTIAPAHVEQYLRQSGVKLADANGDEEYTPERMLEVLDRAQAHQRAILKAVPRRKAWLEQHAQAHAQVTQAIPWVNQVEDERHALMQNILGQFPALRSQPNYEYWVAAAIEGHLALQQRAKVKANGPGPAPKPPVANPGAVRRGLPNTANGGAVRPTNVNGKLSAARDLVRSKGSREALGAYLEAGGFVR